MKASLFFLFLTIIFCYNLSAQTIIVNDYATYYIQRISAGQPCSNANTNPKFYLTGTYTRSTTDYNGKPQYEKPIGLSSGGSVCINSGRSGSTTLASDKFYIRWINDNWFIAYITAASPETMKTNAIFRGTGPTPSCYTYDGRVLVAGSDCYCHDSLNLAGNAMSGDKYALSSINSSQIIGNTIRLSYRATNGINLDAGFQIASGGVFEAKIEGCDQP